MTTQIDPAEAGGGVLGAEEVTSGETVATQLDLDDIQGNILRGYHVQFGRHFLLTSTQPAATRTFLAALVNGGTQGLRISRASDDPRAHTYHLNLGLTWEGLNAIGVPPGVWVL